MPVLYISEVKYLGGASVDFIEVAVTAGTDVSNIQVIVYNASGTVRSTNSLGTLVSTLDGKDVYVIDKTTSATFTGLHKFGGVALVDNGTVDSFISFDDGSPITATAGPANGLTSTQIGSAGSGSSLETNVDGGSYTLQNSPNSGTIPCFTPGTYIATPQGDRLIESLNSGDLVITRDHGLQSIRWVGHKKITGARLYADPYIRPIRIERGAFGPEMPNRDMLVSPQHRMVINHNLAQKIFGAARVLIPAKALLDNDKIAIAQVKSTTYIHLMFDHHEIIFANGHETESFHPQKAILNDLDQQVQNEIYEIFPELHAPANAGGYGPTALPALSVSEGQYLAQAIWGGSQTSYQKAS
jgi:hypothetical protein